MEKVKVEEGGRNRDDSSVESDGSDKGGNEVDSNGKNSMMQEGIDDDGETGHPCKNMYGIIN
eukprot:5615313-Ditylum_brightwellii.AAC.1